MEDNKTEIEKPKKKSNKKVIIKTILITLLITALVIWSGIFLFNYELERNQEFYNAGRIEGLLYTQQTGKMVLIVDENLTSITLPEEWMSQIQQYLNLEGGQ